MNLEQSTRKRIRRTGKSCYMFAVMGTALSIASLLVTIWIVVPAPLYQVWLLSVVASEWSLWFGLCGFAGALCSIVALRLFCEAGVWRAVNCTGATCGAIALALSLVPLLSALGTARERQVNLSLRQYVAGAEDVLSSDGIKKSDRVKIDFTTHTFATVAGNELRLDAYVPPVGVSGNGAGIVIVHGGSWNAGSRSDFPQWNRWLTAQGYAVFDVDYRLAPQPNWQTATGDVKCAVLWIKANHAKFGISPERLALLGRSAGGHLALLAAYTNKNANLPSSCAQSNNNADDERAFGNEASVRAVVSFYAPTDLLWSYDHPANRFVIDGPLTLRRFIGGSPAASKDMHERFQLASPVAHVDSRSVPTLLIHGDADQLVRADNTVMLAARLEQLAVPHETIVLPYAQHGFDYNFNGWSSQLLQPVLRDFLRKHLTAR